MRILLFLIFFFIQISCFAQSNSENTIGGYTAQAHLIQVSGDTLTPSPYLDFVTGATGDTLKGITHIYISGSGGGNASPWNITDGVHSVNSVGQLTVTGGTVGGTTPNATLTVTGGTGTNYWNLGNIGIDTFNAVGIGSTAPGQALDVQGTIRSLYAPMVINGTSSQFLKANGSTDSSTYLTSDLWTSSGSNVYRSAGNVGVANTNPGVTLDVTGTARSTAFWQTGSNFNELAGNTGIGNTNPGQLLDVSGTVRSTSFIETGNTANTFAGNVGINNTSPGWQLDVSGTVRTTGFILSTSPTSGYVLTETGSSGVGIWSPATAGTVTSSGSPSSGNIPKFTTATNIAPAAASDIVNLFSTCSGSQYLGADGSCHNSGSGTPGGSSPQLQYNNAGAFGGITATASNGNNIGIGTTDLVNVLAIVGNVGIGTVAAGPYTTQAAVEPQVVMQGDVGIGTWQPVALFQVGGSGNVGIGSLAPQAPLDIQGLTRIENGNLGIGTVTIPTAMYVVGTGMFTTGLNVGIGTGNTYQRVCIHQNQMYVGANCP